MSVNYQLRDEVKSITICLYCPSASSEETQYTFSSLWDYILDCGYQLEQGDRIRRFPYHLATCRADADRAQSDFKIAMASLRKARASQNGTGSR